MAIISRSDSRGKLQFRSNQFRFGMIYLLITFVVLIFLNIYCSKTSQDMFFQSKKASMQEKAQLVASSIGELEITNAESVMSAVNSLDDLKVTRLIVTNAAGGVLYDNLSEETGTVYCLYPEIVEALLGNDVFTSKYHDGVLESQAAAPILSYSNLTGSVYIMEYDVEQGSLIKSLATNVLTVSLVLAGFLLLFSLLFSAGFTRRLRRIMASIRTIREGDYSHKVHLRGQDELTVLGNEFNDLSDRLQKSEERRRQFVSDASHELKTPLASIKLLSDSILQNEMDMDTIREFVSDIGDEADRLNRMSYKLLSLAKVDASQETTDCEIIYMMPTIYRVIRMLSAIADQAGVTIHTELIRDSSILIQEDDLYQIVFNLVENGIKYNLPDGQLHILLDRREDNAVLTIRDTGVGIPESSIGHIFERFYRVDKARSRQSGGSGLGLAIVRDMVKRNRGQIWVDSRVGDDHGTTFTLEFPVFDIEEDDA